MPGPSWGEDSAADEVGIARKLGALVRRLLGEAPARVDPSLALGQQWHREIYTGASSPPGPHYLGAWRGSGHPDLLDYEVVLRDRLTGQVLSAGVPAADVAAELATFETSLRLAVSRLDAAIPPGGQLDPQQLLSVIELAAVVHGEWVRIHPFANGNGRVARTWANWVAVRYGLPPFVRIKPRPDGLLYGRAAHLSMARPPDHRLTVQVFLDLLRQSP